MQTRRIIHTLLALSLAAPFAAHATPLGIKAGGWKETYSITIHGMLRLYPKEELAKLTPEQRQKKVAYLKALDGKPSSSTDMTCVQQTDTVKSLLEEEDSNGECTHHIIKHTRDSLEAKISCHNADMGSYSGLLHFRALSATHLVTTMDIKNASGVKVHGVRDARWLSATCTNQ